MLQQAQIHLLPACALGMVAFLLSTRPALAHPELVESDITDLDQIYETLFAE